MKYAFMVVGVLCAALAARAGFYEDWQGLAINSVLALLMFFNMRRA